MVRTLFILAAVVAAILAVVLTKTWLYIVSILLLLSALAVLTFFQQRRSRQAAPVDSGAEDELASLGIMDVRPRAFPERGGSQTSSGEDGPSIPASPARQAGSPPRLSQEEAAPPAPATGDGSHPASAVRVMREASKREPAVISSNTEAVRKGVLLPCLQSLLAAVRGHTVCLLRQSGSASRYRIEAVVSLSANARSRGPFNARPPFLETTPGEVFVSSIGDDGVPEDHLSYYHEPVDVRQAAWTLLPGFEEARYVLLADTRREIGFTAQEPALLADFAQLLAALLEAAEVRPAAGSERAAPAEAEAETALEEQDEAEQAAPAAEEQAEVPVEPVAPATAARPRREIIAEEIERATTEDRALALALIYLNRAEDVAEAGEEAVAEAEAALEQRLHDHTPEGRVERFGELTYGVFLEGSTAEAWATHLHDQLADEAGPLEGGVSIGVALLSERHQSPDALRNDATKALQEAYQTGTSTILE